MKNGVVVIFVLLLSSTSYCHELTVAKWLGDDVVISDGQNIQRVDPSAQKTNRVIWTCKFELKLDSIAVAHGRIFALTEKGAITEVDSSTGKKLAFLTNKQLAKTIGKIRAYPLQIFLNSSSELIVIDYSSRFERCGFRIDIDTRKVKSSFDVDCHLNSSRISNGTIAISKLTGFFCVRDVLANKDIYKRGERRRNVVMIDGDRIKEVFYDQKQKLVVLATVNGWTGSKIQIIDTTNNKESVWPIKHFPNFSIDVDFQRRRIAAIDSNGNVQFFSFAGKLLCVVKDQVVGTDHALEISPDGKKLVVVSIPLKCIEIDINTTNVKGNENADDDEKADDDR